MTLFFAVGGVDLGNSAVRLEGGIASLTAYANGSVATAGVEVDDPTGVLNFIDLQTFTVTETACTAAPRCFTGYIYNLRQKRGPFRNGAGRVWVFDVGDLNFLLHLQKTRGTTGKRPRETIDARVAWLMSTSGMSGIVFDHGQVASRGSSMVDEADYRKNYHDEVWQDIATGWIFFVYYDQATGQPSMFFNDPTAAVNTSTLTISNVNSDLVANPTTCFAPNEDSELLAAGEDIYCAVDYTYIGDANIYRHSATTHNAFFTDPNFHRVGDVTSSRVGKLATAEAEAASFLVLHSGQMDTITCVVQLPASKVNLIDAGMRISVRFSFLTGYTAFAWTRVTSRTVTLAAGTNEFYDVQLELSVKGIGQLSGGAPGDFPHIGCAGAPDLIQHTESAGPGFTLTTAPTPGKLLVASFGERVAGGLVTFVGFTLIDRATDFLGNHRSCSMWYRVVQAGDGTSWPFSGVAIGSLMEWNATGIDASVRADDQNPGSGHMLCGGSITPPAGSAVTILGGASIGEFDPVVYSVTPDAGVTELQDDHNPVVGSPYSWVGYKTATSASGSYSVGGTIVESTSSGRNQYAGITVTLVCDASTNPPGPATWIYGEGVTMSGANGTTAFPFADGSLSVFVDNIDETAAITSYDGAAGTFTLGFAPRPFETVTVQYQGR